MSVGMGMVVGQVGMVWWRGRASVRHAYGHAYGCGCGCGWVCGPMGVSIGDAGHGHKHETCHFPPDNARDRMGGMDGSAKSNPVQPGSRKGKTARRTVRGTSLCAV